MRTHYLKPFDDGKYLSEEDALKLLESIPIPEKLEEQIEVPLASMDTAKQSTSKYILMPRTDTYALGLNALQEACLKENNQNHPPFTKSDNLKIYRPLTFKENIQARVEHYETTNNSDGSERTLDERLFLITERWNDSCTALVYKKGTTKFKIVPISEHLVTLNSDFRKIFLRVDYNAVNGTELDSSKKKYNTLMSQGSVLKHEGWLAAVEGDKALLQSYANIVFTELKRKYDKTKGMAFWVWQNTVVDQLQAFLVSSLSFDSNANGSNSLSSSGSFLRRSPSLEASRKK